jgi:hypothetical protein
MLITQGRDWRVRTFESLGEHQQAANDRLKELRDNPEGPYEGMGVIPQDWADCAESFVNAGDHSKAKKPPSHEWHLKLASVGALASYVDLDAQGPHLRMSDWNFDVSIPRARRPHVSSIRYAPPPRR